MSTVEITRPDDRLQVNYQNEPRELFMSFRRRNDCMRAIGDPQNLTFFALDPDMSERVVTTMLAPTAGPGSTLNFEVPEDAITEDDYEAIVLFVQAHLTFFFLKQFQNVGQHMKAMEPIAERLKSSLTGSQPLSSNEASAGPSE